MTAPRLEIDLDKIQHNARILIERLGKKGISVTGVTKAVLGNPQIARGLLYAGVKVLGDSRIENIQTIRQAGIVAPTILLRSPMLSQVDQVVAQADISLNTELDAIEALSSAARKANRSHGVILMVELGDLREGIMPEDVEKIMRSTLRLPNIVLRGIGANLACRSGASPDAKNMADLSALVNSLEATFGITVGIVSGGNSASLTWALSGAETGRVNNLRLGESVLLGLDPLHRRPIEGLHTDAFELIGEVIESKTKPSKPWGEIGQAAFGPNPSAIDKGRISQTIVAIGHQDTDPGGLVGPRGVEIIGASSDHLILDTGKRRLMIGEEIAFQPNYSALVRAMASPFVSKVVEERTRYDQRRNWTRQTMPAGLGRAARPPIGRQEPPRAEAARDLIA